jgi:hypothetical protein
MTSVVNGDVFVPTPTVHSRSLGPALDRVGWRLLIAVAVLATSSLSIGGPENSFSVGFQSMNNLVDPFLIAVGLSQLVGISHELAAVLRRNADRVSVVVTAWMMFVVWVATSWLMNPRPYGMFLVVRLIGVAGAIRLLGRSSPAQRTSLLRVLIIVTAVQVAVCAAQLAVGGSVGLYGLGEVPDPFMRHPDAAWRVPMGLSFYPYPVAANALLCLAMLIFLGPSTLTRSWRWLGNLSAGATIGLTASVSALVAVAAVLVGAALWSGFDRHRIRQASAGVLIPFLLALAIGTVAQQSVWLWKSDRTVAVQEGNASSGRSGQIKTAVEMIKREPVFGVGPGAYRRYRVKHPELDAITTDTQIVHSVPILMAAETGLVGPLLLGVAVLVAVWRRFRQSAVLFAALSGYVLGDFMHWYRGVGLMQWGVALGLTVALSRAELSSTKSADRSTPTSLRKLTRPSVHV